MKPSVPTVMAGCLSVDIVSKQKTIESMLFELSIVINKNTGGSI